MEEVGETAPCASSGPSSSGWRRPLTWWCQPHRQQSVGGGGRIKVTFDSAVKKVKKVEVRGRSLGSGAVRCARCLTPALSLVGENLLTSAWVQGRSSCRTPESWASTYQCFWSQTRNSSSLASVIWLGPERGIAKKTKMRGAGQLSFLYSKKKKKYPEVWWEWGWG